MVTQSLRPYMTLGQFSKIIGEDGGSAVVYG
jgi:hypothetical protein